MALKIQNEVLEIIKNLDKSYFDGHTEFEKFNYEQRIVWLIQISLFIFEVFPFTSNLLLIDN